MTTETVTYTVPGMNCGRCRVAVTEEVTEVEGVAQVAVDLEAKQVIVSGTELDDRKLRAAIDEAGYEVA